MPHTATHSKTRCGNSRKGVTAIELIVVVGVLTILLSLVLPMIYAIRASAHKVQCSTNLRQIQQAMVMYSNDYSRLGEVYPDYITNLYGSSGQQGSGYINDLRAFVCPMDNTNAQKNSYGKTALKPIYSVTPKIPIDDKSDWAERYANGLNQQNCSYLYEFSNRICQTYVFNTSSGFTYWNDGTPSSFGSTYLVRYDSDFQQFYGANGQDPDPLLIDRARNYVTLPDGTTQGTITWQDAKFYQLENGDIFCSGLEDWTNGGYPQPPASAVEPTDYYLNNSDIYVDDSLKMGGYPRTWMPMIRCFWHQTPQKIDSEDTEQVLNVALDGNIFSSAPFWERTAFKYGKSIQGTNSDPNNP